MSIKIYLIKNHLSMTARLYILDNGKIMKDLEGENRYGKMDHIMRANEEIIWLMGGAG